MYRLAVTITPVNSLFPETRTSCHQTMTEATQEGLAVARAAWIAHEMTITDEAVPSVRYTVSLAHVAQGRRERIASSN